MISDDRSPGPGSIYERVIVAAREAKRLNERQMMTRVTPRRKVTTEAISRVSKGNVDFRYAEGPKEEPESFSPVSVSQHEGGGHGGGEDTWDDGDDDAGDSGSEDGEETDD